MVLGLREVVAFGPFGVDVFFVLSGIAIGYATRRDSKTMTWLGNFILRRVIRLTPPYWAAIAIMAGILWVQASVGHSTVGDRLLAPVIVANVLYLQELLGLENLNVVFWTLAIELQFYLAYGFLAVITSMIGSKWPRSSESPKVTLFALSGALSLLFPFRNFTFLPYWYMFTLGLFVWWAIEKSVSQKGLATVIGALAIWAGVTGSLAVLVAALTAGLL